jgi:hypothetical protein
MENEREGGDDVGWYAMLGMLDVCGFVGKVM